MITIKAKTITQFTNGLKKFQPVIAKARSADINESDTVTIITDILCEILGYDKYTHITSEFSIKKTFCDLAIKIDNKVCLLIECKAAGMELKDDHIRQATNYAADSGIEWAVLTNGTMWKIFKILFTKPIEKELVYEFDISKLNIKKQSDLEMLYYLSIESMAKGSKATLEDLYTQKKIINKYTVGQLILTEPVITALKKQLKKLSSDIKVSDDEILSLLQLDILKREIVEGEESNDAKKKIVKMEKTVQKTENKGE